MPIDCRFSVDVATPKSDDAIRVVVEMDPKERQTYADGAQVYKCTVRGPPGLVDHAGGRARETNGNIFLELSHFTTEAAAKSILREQRLQTSSWTIQGLRQLSNIGHAYFTTLPDVSSEADLRRIAMASDEEIQFTTTRHQAPEEILSLRVYRGSTLNRTHCVRLWVPLSTIAPPDLLFHFPRNLLGYYEIVSPEIIRVSLPSGEALAFDDNQFVSTEARSFRYDYVIVGDAEMSAGVAAPFIEVERFAIGHVERMIMGEDVLSFWSTNANKNLFDGRNPSWREFR